jgi:uncharacterized protein
MTQPDLDAARDYALGRLARELDPRLSYHSIVHTRDDVLPAVERLAAQAGVGGDDLVDLQTAALFHDIGFVASRTGHETQSVAVAAAVLPQFGYEVARLERITGMILATRLPQSPQTPLEQLLADADLDMLGRPDFRERNQALRTELEAFEGPLTDRQWYHGQVAFVASHHYWTAVARQLRDVQKAHNLLALRAALAHAR